MIVGLTGGIASGKTVVTRVFHLLGAAVFMSDEVARESYFDRDLQIKIKEILGSASYKSVTEIDRKYIASKIFADPALRNKVNDLIHPYVGKKFSRFVNENKGRLIIKESALLFEANIADQCDKVIVIAADDDIRIRRICERDQVSEAEAVRRLSSQLPQSEKITRADIVLYNNEKALLIPQINSLYKQLISGHVS